jgi:hypothetical protein
MNPTSKLHVLLALSTMDDAELLVLAGNIGTLGPQSPLFANGIIASGVNTIAAKAVTFTASCKTVKDTAKQLSDDKTAKGAVRVALETEITAFVGNATNIATTLAQLTSLALTPRPQVVMPKLGPPVPGLLIAKMPKYQKGYFDVSVNEIGGTRGRYAAESSPDPIATWTVLSGTGKSRRVFGVSGTKVWVRFARVRGQVQSDWCAPLLVVIP